MEKIKILGAGLSGLSAAINLAKAGYNVDVFEKSDDCGKRFHGDLEGLENWSSTTDILDELESMNIKTSFNFTPFNEFLFSDGKQLLKSTFDKPVFYIVKRGFFEDCLDQNIKNQAINLGVNIYFNSKTNYNDVDIISTGPSKNNINMIAKGMIFETNEDNITVSLLNKKTSNGGYSYLLISNGIGCICTVCFREFEHINIFFKNTREVFEKLFDLKIRKIKNFGGIGRYRIKLRLKKDKKLFTGEAAGLQDCLWGFGMRYAFISGYLASKSIIENIDYKKLIKQTILGRVKTSLVNRYLCEKAGERFNTYLMNQAKKNKDWLTLLYNNYNPSMHTRLIYPFAKWNLSKK